VTAAPQGRRVFDHLRFIEAAWRDLEEMTPVALWEVLPRLVGLIVDPKGDETTAEAADQFHRFKTQPSGWQVVYAVKDHQASEPPTVTILLVSQSGAHAIAAEVDRRTASEEADPDSAGQPANILIDPDSDECRRIAGVLSALARGEVPPPQQ
jgi:hypothetical protein